MTLGEQHLEFWTERLSGPPFVYVIQGDEGGPVKVGFAGRDVRDRINTLQCGNPQELRLIHVLVGTRELEWGLHGKMAEARIRGEWFGGDSLAEHLDFIEALATWMVDGYREQGKLRDFRRFGSWPVRTPRQSKRIAVSHFVDPADIALPPEEIERRARERQALRKRKWSKDNPFNPARVEEPVLTRRRVV